MSSTPAVSLSPWFPPAPTGAVAPKPLRAIGIIGTSRTATAVAHWCATKGLGVILHDLEPGALTQAVEIIRGLFRTAEERNEISHAAAHKAMGGIGITTSQEDMEFCDLVIDTHTEDATSKRARFTELSRVMPPESVLASRASVAGLEEIFAVTKEPGRVIGLVFFDPVATSPQVQVTIGSRTTRLTAERVLGFLTVLGKTPVMQGPSRSG